MQRTVVILLSDKRSGSTLLQELLCRHPAIQHVTYSPHTYFETHHWLKAACLLGQPPALFDGGIPYRGYGSRGGARSYLVDCVRGNVPHFVVPSDPEELVFSGWNTLCERFAQPVFFEKSPQHPAHWAALDLMLRWARTASFNVRFLSLVRNPMAVMYSACERFATPPTARQFGWLRCYQNILLFERLVGAAQFHWVHYEALVREPVATLDGVTAFLGLAGAPSPDPPPESAPLERWRRDPAFTFDLHPSVACMAAALGYAAAELRIAPNVAPSGRHSPQHRTHGWVRLVAARFEQRLLRPTLLRIKHARRSGDT